MEQRSPEWFAARKGRITGSAVGAILGLSPFNKPKDIMRKMVRDYIGLPNEFTGNVATEWGTLNEPGALKEYEMLTNNTVEPATFVMYEDWLGASPDGLIREDGLIEIKCPYGIRNHDVPKFKTIEEQPHYHAQIQVQLLVTGRKWCDFFQWTPKNMTIQRVNFSEDYTQTLIKGLRAFWDEYLHEREHNQDKYR